MSRLDTLKAQREELDKKIKELAAADAKEKRKLDDRRKTILGGWLLQNRPELVANIIANLTRDQDKAAFKDFTPPQAAPKAAAVPTPTPQPKLQATGT